MFSLLLCLSMAVSECGQCSFDFFQIVLVCIRPMTYHAFARALTKRFADGDRVVVAVPTVRSPCSFKSTSDFHRWTGRRQTRLDVGTRWHAFDVMGPLCRCTVDAGAAAVSPSSRPQPATIARTISIACIAATKGCTSWCKWHSRQTGIDRC